MATLLVQWEISWQLGRVGAALESLRRRQLSFGPPAYLAALRSLTSAAMSTADRQATALSILKGKLLSVNELIALPAELKAELAEQLAAVVGANLDSRHSVFSSSQTLQKQKPLAMIGKWLTTAVS